jgi:hypothetical protein
MEIQIPLETALLWLGGSYDPEFDIYQIEFGGTVLHMQVFEDRGYATVICTKRFSVEALTECCEYMEVVAAY